MKKSTKLKLVKSQPKCSKININGNVPNLWVKHGNMEFMMKMFKNEVFMVKNRWKGPKVNKMAKGQILWKRGQHMKPNYMYDRFKNIPRSHDHQNSNSNLTANGKLEKSTYERKVKLGWKGSKT